MRVINRSSTNQLYFQPWQVLTCPPPYNQEKRIKISLQLYLTRMPAHLFTDGKIKEEQGAAIHV